MLRHLIGHLGLAAALGSLMVAPAAAAEPTEPAEQWQASGSHFNWVSPLPENHGRSVKVFYRCAGDPAKPTLVMLHGFPTSSFDFRPMFDLLQADFHVCTLDFPGFGLSDKPADGFVYSLSQDAQLVWDFVSRILGVKEFILFSHDRGDSVALRFLQLYQAAPTRPFVVTHQFLTNANLYLPLANLTHFQKVMLNPQTSAVAVSQVTPKQLAIGMGETQYSPPLPPDDAEVRALEYNFAYQDGVRVIPATIQYLNERKKFEDGYLASLAASDVPVTLIWGVHDMVSPVRVANHVWSSALATRAAPASYWLAPCANHYLLHDQPQAIAALMRAELGLHAPAAPANLAPDACAPVLVDRH
ncbi:MAG: alpha/beta hydrolase [Burkholderiales bacterium]|nr:alpha/beta hydrolase [Burkholderiales bacterium]